MCSLLNKKFKKAHLNSVLTSIYNWQLFVTDSTSHTSAPLKKSSSCLMQHLAQQPLGQKRSIPQTKNDTKYKVLILKHIP